MRRQWPPLVVTIATGIPAPEGARTGGLIDSPTGPDTRCDQVTPGMIP
jgi:hypothetical protein